MSIVTIKWQGGSWEQPKMKEFEYTGGGGFTIYQSIISLLATIKDVEDEAVRAVKAETILMNESLKKIYEIMGLPK